MASATADAPPRQKPARRHDHPQIIVAQQRNRPFLTTVTGTWRRHMLRANDHCSFADICFSVTFFYVRREFWHKIKHTQQLLILLIEHLGHRGWAGYPISSRRFPTSECKRAATAARCAQLGPTLQLACSRPAQNVCSSGRRLGIASAEGGAHDPPAWCALSPVGSPST